jgi:hypothetical protein
VPGVSAYPSVKIVKDLPFKGGTRLWSNRYHFNGGSPADSTHWHTFFDAIVAAEKAIYTGAYNIRSAVGYDAGSDVPVDSKTYSVAGTLTPSGTPVGTPGQTAALLRWSTTQRTTKNHPIYLFNYFHGALVAAGTGGEDVLNPGQRTAIGTYAAAWIAGLSDGTVTHKRCGPNGAVAQGSFVAEYVTHRDFPYTSSA